MAQVPVFQTGNAAHRRIKELMEDGYVVVAPIEKVWTLTDKGWRCLFAAADRPIKPPSAQKKEAA